MRRFGPVVRAAARRAGADLSSLEDVEQATWTMLLRHAASIREPRSLPAWVVTTATREAWRLGRRSRRRDEAESRHGEECSEALDEPQDAVRLELVQAIRDGVGRLDTRCRGLLHALFLDPETASYEELSKDLGLPQGSIGPTRQRCLAKLGRELERRGLRLEDEP